MSVRLYLLYTEKPDERVLRKIIPKLPSSSQEKVFKNHSLKEQWRATLSDLLLRNVLAQELDVSPTSIEIEINSHGKPFLNEEKRYFNLSHSEAIIVIATDNTPIGIDVEYIQPLDDLEHLLVNFSHEEQQAYQARAPE
ncbi:MAG: 4'-phosphopantetheinyl transferase family protein, partial [Rhabdochlamydiaceae bacterium]